MHEAPNESYLAMKVITIIGVAGACRTDEMHKMKITDVEAKEDLLQFLLFSPRCESSAFVASNHIPRMFTFVSEFVAMLTKYVYINGSRKSKFRN